MGLANYLQYLNSKSILVNLDLQSMWRYIYRCRYSSYIIKHFWIQKCNDCQVRRVGQ